MTASCNCALRIFANYHVIPLGVLAQVRSALITSHPPRVIPNFRQAGWSPAGNIASFFHEQLNWAFLNKLTYESEIEWLCEDIDDFKVINIYKSTGSSLAFIAILVFENARF